MDMKKTITIDLSEYGGEGEVVLRAPTFRRMIEMKNEMGKYAKLTNGNVVTSDSQGYAELIGFLVYIAKAPFKANCQSFLAFADKLDEVELGNADRLWNRIVEAVKEIDKGDDRSPFADSPEAEMSTSES